MKKGILVLIVVALVLGLTSCSQDVYSKLGDIMGKMGNNVYGISANMTQVQAATESLSGSVSDDGSVDLDKAAEIISAVAEVKNSAQKTEALKEELSKPVTDDATTAAAVQTELQNKVSDVSSSLEAAIAAAPEEQKQLLEDVKAAIDAIEISDNPTMAELATVAVLNEIAKTASDVADKVAADSSSLLDENGLTEEGMAIADSALGSLDTLKVVSEVANVDVLGDLNIAVLLSSFRDVSRDSDVETYMKSLSVTVAKLFSLMTKDGEFNEARYNSFIAQCKALKSCYDLAASPYTANAKKIADFDAVLTAQVDLGFTVEDLASYIVFSAFTLADKIAPEASKAVVEAFVTENKAALENFGSSVEFKLPNTNDFMDAVFEFVGGTFDPETAGEDLLKSAIEGKLAKDGLQIVGVSAVILVDSEYQSLLKLVNEEGTISAIMADLSK
ncbi:MAG: hypothetical protein MJ057_00875 [Sphaerochaetaceae bacterium]|nr:hypothetical protein [Sphaerochaetaceae bacterium]